MKGGVEAGYWRNFTSSAGLAVLFVVVSVAVAAALFGLAYLLSDVWIVARLFLGIGITVAVVGFYASTPFLFDALLGPKLFQRLFCVRDKALTQNAIRELTAVAAAPVTVPLAPGRGVLRIVPIKPAWWNDPDAYDDDTRPVVVVEETEHRLPEWNPYDIAVPAGMVEVVAWLPRRNGIPGRPASGLVDVPAGGVGTLVYRPSSLPELPGTAADLAGELWGETSSFRTGLVTTVLIGLAVLGWLVFG
ncbi:hypothetical protein [Micromonospora sp. WMMD1155]|uniref:hypothetical protein n=1 Tax=Micromonospora sp. WMMD1155 TaxID=3016094 RepID=UPI00249AF149|nr:hypothetical protein [Micromonospora sp. WMMD1155]WFE50788.1 hypothetical protein O7617_10830 [Micromonospora sp. WMMD1155]